LRYLDGRSLGAANSATAGFRVLATNPDTWHTDLLPAPARAFCALSLPSSCRSASSLRPSPSPADAANNNATSLAGHELPSDLVSVVDLYRHGALLLSRFVETSTSSSWFPTSSFRVDLVECKSPHAHRRPWHHLRHCGGPRRAGDELGGGRPARRQRNRVGRCGGLGPTLGSERLQPGPNREHLPRRRAQAGERGGRGREMAAFFRRKMH
jgi:hypothetical protein